MADNVQALYQAVMSGSRANVDAAMANMSIADVPVVMSFFNGLPMADKQALATVYDANPNIVPAAARGTIASALANVPRANAQAAQPQQRAKPEPEQQPRTRNMTPTETRQPPRVASPTRLGATNRGQAPMMALRAQPPARQATPAARAAQLQARPQSQQVSVADSFVGASQSVSQPSVSQAHSMPSSGYGGLSPVEYGMAATPVPDGWSFSGGLWSR